MVEVAAREPVARQAKAAAQRIPRRKRLILVLIFLIGRFIVAGGKPFIYLIVL
jgi:hypothetical protein